MSYSIITLFAVIMVQSICAFFAFRETRELKAQLSRLKEVNADCKKLNAFLLKCDAKNVEFIGKLIQTNQEQAKKIRTLKNRISF